MHDRTALSLVSIRLYMYGIYDIPRSGIIRDALAKWLKIVQIAHAVKMLEYVGIFSRGITNLVRLDCLEVIRQNARKCKNKNLY